MKLVRSSVEIPENIDGVQILKTLEKVARTCYKSEDKITEDDSSARKLIGTIMQVHHESILEFVDITVKFTCSRACANEIVRHRVGSYSQESTRYCNYSKDKFGNELTFIQSCYLDEVKLAQYGPYHLVSRDKSPESIFICSLNNAEKDYLTLIEAGWKPEEARDVLPLCLKTEINVKYNLREWRHFFELRCSSKAHPEIRLLARTLLKRFHEEIPLIFDDLYETFILHADSKSSVQ